MTTAAVARPPQMTTPISAAKETESIWILDFGSQFTQLIARRVRELGVFSRVVPCTVPFDDIDWSTARGIITLPWAFPDVPAAAEAGLPGYDFASWGGVFAPAGTPRTVVQKLNAEIGTALALPGIRKRFGDMGLVTKHSTPEEFSKFLQSEIARWRALLAKKL